MPSSGITSYLYIATNLKEYKRNRKFYYNRFYRFDFTSNYNSILVKEHFIPDGILMLYSFVMFSKTKLTVLWLLMESD
jgi:hypothetical protein